jgi:tripartite-type tricarboxylate transporter receptor subunit TctC
MAAMCFTIAHAQEYPTRPIRMLATEAGGGTDFVARLIAQGLTESLHRQVIVDNRGNQAAQIAAKAPGDGYTLALLGPPLWVSPLLQPVQYDPINDFSPITLATTSANVLIVHPSLPASSVKELITYAKSKPGELNYGSSMTGSSNQLAAELFKFMAGVDIVRVPYKGAAQALTDVIGGAVQLAFPSAAAAVPHIKSGRLRGLAVTSAAPSAFLPGLTTVSAAGVPGYESVAMFGLLAPGRTPAAVITRLNQDTVRFLARPAIKEKFGAGGNETVGGTPAQFAAAMASDVANLSKMIKATGMRAD